MITKIPIPQEIKYHSSSRVLELGYADGAQFDLSAEYLRVHSPSAEVRGHGPGQEVLQIGKEDVRITQIEPIGHYAVRLHFDDGHNTGLYSWEELFDLGARQEELWQGYLDRLEASGHRRKDTSASR